MDSTKIINGVPAEAGEFPFFCTLNTSDDASQNGHCCGGILINKRWVLTTAFCAENCNNKKVYIGIEKYLPDAKYKDKVEIDSIHLHPNWVKPPKDPNGFDVPYNIALIRLAQETTSNDFAKINGLNINVEFPVGTEMVVAGFGAYGNDPNTNRLLKTALTIAEDKNCLNVPDGYPPTLFDSKIHICTRGLNTTVGTDDWGGPLMLKDKTVVGLSTRKFLDNASEFTRVSYYKEWIKLTINV